MNFFGFLKAIYMASQLVEKGKQFERSAKFDKEAAYIKYKDNRKHFELNLRLDNMLTTNRGECY